ncbi:DUF1566 domain-containing protein [Candidatus Sulfurimonas baltica]|uniref:DUF1566 domain-containing protein n=1 Tax=Candidatus Sulfurimonas baltica TaxID=2740404 RepID=A0A7S7RNJ6_9BACT|nr:DUF1566 domain-containing protein [Candidatus Sulfurimonas baltica]QOY52619.1 DUF1566 domain-containing protein [Candidatus Sulfurimonas baltica]
MKTNNIFIGFLLAFGLVLSGCGGSGSSSDSSAITTVTGQFIDSPVEGLNYDCSSGKAGITNSEGEYTCNVGDTVTFKIGDVVIGSVKAQNDFITPYSLFPDDDISALNLARLLQTLDIDSDPSNGLKVNEVKAILLPTDTNFASNTFVTNIENALNITLVTEDEAKNHMDDFVKHIIVNNSLESASAEQVSASDMVLEVITQPKNGKVALNIDGSYTYTPNTDFIGNDSFSYKAGDGTIKTIAFSVEPKYELLNRSDRIIVDNTTKLEWQDSYPDNEDKIKTATIEEAQSYCSELTLGGLSDWRVPNFTELKSIIDLTKEPALNHIFQEQYTTGLLGAIAMEWMHAYSSYDKATTTDDDIWKISAIKGVGTKSDGSIAIVKCVRGTEIEEAPHQYQRNSITGIVIDNKNNLDWQDNYNDNGGNVKQATFYNSIDYCNNLVLGGYDNWKLPTLDEMSMLIQEEKGVSTFQNTITEDSSLGGVDYSYWTSASDISGAYSWAVDMKNSLYGYGYLFGQEEIGKKDKEASVRCVRNRPNINFTPIVINTTASPEANSAIADLVGTITISKLFADTSAEGLKTLATMAGDTSSAYKNTADILYYRSSVAFNQSSDWNSFTIKEAFRFDEEAKQFNALAGDATQKKLFYDNYIENSESFANGLTGLGMIIGGYNAWGHLQDGNYVAAGLESYSIGLDGITLGASLASVKIASSSLLGQVLSGTSKINITSSLASAIMSGYTVFRDTELQTILESYITRHQTNSDMRMFYINKLVEAYIESTIDYVTTPEKPASDMIPVFSNILKNYFINKSNGDVLMGDDVFYQYLNNLYVLQNNYQATSINELSRENILEIAATFTIRAMAEEEDNILETEMINLTSSDNFRLSDYLASITGDGAFDMFRKINEVREALFSSNLQRDIESSYKMFLAEHTLNVLYESGQLYTEIFSVDGTEFDTDGDTIPNLIDTDDDNDGMPDKWEIANGLDPLADDASLDNDGDGRNNLFEYQDGTNPLVIDTIAYIAHNGVTYGTVTSPYTQKVWLDRNLGASKVCTAYNDTACYGDYYQWGREADGHEKSNSTITSTQASDITSVGDNYIKNSSYPYDWTGTDSNGSVRLLNWSATDGSSICPVGYRVPTEVELKAETTDVIEGLGGRQNIFDDFLKLPAAGWRLYTDGIVREEASDGKYWVNSPEFSYSRGLVFGPVGMSFGSYGRSRAHSIRCIQDTTQYNTAPTANAGADQNVTEGTSVTLDATASSDSDGTIASHEWKDGTTVLSTAVSFSKSDFTVGTHTITLTVTDNGGATATDTVVVTVNAQTLTIFQSGNTWKGLVYETAISPYTGRVWLDRNLGASQACTAYNDTACYGDYYQWGRGTDGHQISTSTTIMTQAIDVNNAGANFIVKGTDWSVADWSSVDSNGSIRNTNWSKTDGTSICPIGYKVPTIEEIRLENISNSSLDAYNHFLKLPSAGYRYGHSGGSMLEEGTFGYYWTSSSNFSGSYDFFFYTNHSYPNHIGRADGYPVRCIKD